MIVTIVSWHVTWSCPGHLLRDAPAPGPSSSCTWPLAPGSHWWGGGGLLDKHGMRIVWHEWKRKQGKGYWFHQTPSIFRHEATKTRKRIGEKNIICFIVFGKFQYEPWDKVSITASLNVQKNIVCSSVDANLAAILVVIVIEEYYLTVRCLKLEGRNIICDY